MKLLPGNLAIVSANVHSCTNAQNADAPPVAIILHRSDPLRNLHRFYRLDVQPDLFGAWCFIREWGRIGSAGQIRSVPFSTYAEALAALDRQCRAKQRRGYQ